MHIPLHGMPPEQHKEQQQDGYKQIDHQVADTTHHLLSYQGDLGHDKRHAPFGKQVETGLLLNEVNHLLGRTNHRCHVQMHARQLTDDGPGEQRQGHNQKQGDPDGQQPDRTGTVHAALQPPIRLAQQHIQGEGPQDAVHVRLGLTKEQITESHNQDTQRILPIRFFHDSYLLTD